MFSPFSATVPGQNAASANPVTILQNPTILLIAGAIVILLVLSMMSNGGGSGGVGNFTAASTSSPTFSVTAVMAIIAGILMLLVAAQYAGFQLSYWLSPQAYKASTAASGGSNGRAGGGGKPQPILSDKQVFNIPGNHYTYDDAKAICKAYNADLATYDQIEQAYNLGAEWCNYGWSEGQMALFPTQKQTYDKLQGIKGHHNDCGRPGVNGGYMANPDLQFGVNCYGKKPAIRYKESQLLASVTPFPQTEEDLEFQRKVDSYKSQISDILISPFSYGKWTQL